ncbi:MAG: cobalamin-dependent protein [Clostridia bacterium]
MTENKKYDRSSGTENTGQSYRKDRITDEDIAGHAQCEATHTSLALNCLSSYVRKRGWEVEREEYTINQPRDGIVRELCLKSPDILGMSLYIWNIEKSLSILSDIHLLLPETILILGGPEASDGLLESLPETLQSCAILVRGEGEESLCQVLKALDLPSGCRDGGAWSREALDGLKSVAGISFL